MNFMNELIVATHGTEEVEEVQRIIGNAECVNARVPCAFVQR